MERGRLKQRLSQMFRASLRSSCGVSSRNAADAVQEPIFVSRRYDGGEDEELGRSFSLPPASTLGSLLRGRRDHETVAAAPPAGSQRQSVDCSCRPSAAARGTSLKKLKKKERRVLSTTGAGRSTCPPTSPSPSYYYLKQMEEEMEREEKRLAAKKKKKKKGMIMEKDHKGKRKGGVKKLLSNGYGFTSSSSDGSDNDDVGDCFSSDGPAGGGASQDKDADQVVFSSRSISSDSSEFYHTSRRHPRSKKKASTRRHQQKPGRADVVATGRSRQSSRDDGFRPLVSISSRATGTAAAAASVLVEEEEDMGKEGFAVEKESSDPYEDFRSSMLEMIVEKQMFGAAELERLLRCYLALNTPRHHPTIVEVFSEIWETLFRN